MELDKIYRGMENGAETIGKNFDEIVKFASQMDNTNISNVGKKIWSGAWYMGESQSINPSLPLDQCLSGWLFLYQPYDSKAGQGNPWDMNYVFVPKTHIVEFGGRAVVHHLETLNGSKYNKYIYISNTQILGHKNNNTASKEFVLTRVYAI
ncbi:hypothetical protein ACFJX6_08285 [Enterococcus faecalis]